MKKNVDGNAQEELMLMNRLIPIAVYCLDPTCSYISREVDVTLRCRVLEEFVVMMLLWHRFSTKLKLPVSQALVFPHAAQLRKVQVRAACEETA